MIQQVDLDELALRIHGTYISEPSSDYDSSDDGKSDFDDNYRVNEPHPDFLETKSIVTCEPFQLVKHKKKVKPKATKRPALLVSSVSKITKKYSFKGKGRRRVRSSKTNVKSVMTEIPPSSAEVNKDLDTTVAHNNSLLSVQIITENVEVSIANDTKNNTIITQETFNNPNPSQPQSNPFINSTIEDCAGSSRTFDNVLDFLNHQNYVWLNDHSQQTLGCDVLPNYYAPEVLPTIDKRHTQAGASKKTAENIPNNAGLYPKTRGEVKKLNQVKPAIVSKPSQALMNTKNQKPDSNNKQKQEKQSVQKCSNCILQNKQLPVVPPKQEFDKPANIALDKNVSQTKNISGGNHGIKKSNMGKGNKSVVIPQPSNKKETANLAQSHSTQVQRQPPSNHKITGNTELPNAKSQRRRKPHKVKYVMSLEEERRLAANDEYGYLEYPIKHIKAQNLQSKVQQTKVAGFSDQLPQTSKENMAKRSFKNQNIREHSQNVSKMQSLNINKTPNIHPVMKVHGGLSSLQHNAVSQTNYTNSTNTIPSLMDINPFYGINDSNKPKKNKKKKGGRCSIGVQVGCSYRRMQSAETQTDDIRERQNYFPNMQPYQAGPVNTNRFFYEYLTSRF